LYNRPLCAQRTTPPPAAWLQQSSRSIRAHDSSAQDGPLLGNGRFAGVMSSDTGGPDMGPSCRKPPCKPSRGEIRTFLGMNDFYAAPTNGFSSCGYPDLDGSNKPGMKQVGGVTFVARALGDTPRLNFTAEQRPSNATVLIELAGAGMRLSVRTWAHATEPLMLSELTYLADPGLPAVQQQLELRIEAWTVLGCGLGPNPLVEDSFLPVKTGVNATKAAGATPTTAIWASRDNGFEYQQQPGVYNLTRAVVVSALLPGSSSSSSQPVFSSALGKQQCLPAAAAKHFGGTYLPCAVGNISLKSGQTVTVATVVVSDRQIGWAEPPIEYALRKLGELMTTSSAGHGSVVAVGGAAREAHELWWRDYWSRSWIDWSDGDSGAQLLMDMYYQNLYILALNAAPNSTAAPGLYGSFVTEDQMLWAGDLTLNYNAEAPFYGALSSNRPWLLDGYVATINDIIPTASDLAKRQYPQCEEGVRRRFPVSLPVRYTPRTYDVSYSERKRLR
jgi:hypothetical protein